MTPPFGREVTAQFRYGRPMFVLWPKRGQIIRELRRLEAILRG